MKPTAPVRVALIFGGQSSEHSISCLSAGSILAAIDRDRYDVTAVGICRDGRWVEVTDDPRHWRQQDGVLPGVIGGPAVVLSADPTRTSADLAGQLDVDVVFPVLHGAYGEDGTIQGLLELSGVPYVGSGVLASAAAMDKASAKALLRDGGLPVGDYVSIPDRAWRLEPERVLAEIDKLTYPIFVKPARAGSSVGISKVSDSTQLHQAIHEARNHDVRVIVEESVEGAREIECGVLHRADDDRPRASVCAEILVGAEHEFYNFAAKYLDDTTTVVVPADLDPQQQRQIQEAAVRAYEVMGCEGLARVDFFVRPNGELVINEINTMPGFTKISMFPRMWEASGVGYVELVDTLLQRALMKDRELF